MEASVNSKPFYGRRWLFNKLLGYLELRKNGDLAGVVITGGAGCGKTAACEQIVWPTVVISPQAQLNARLLAYHFCQYHENYTTSPGWFVWSIGQQVATSGAVGPYFLERLEVEPELKLWMELDCCSKYPTVAFARLLSILNDMPTPPETMFVLVDSVHEVYPGFAAIDSRKNSTMSPQSTARRSKPNSQINPDGAPDQLTIAQLLACCVHLFPPWLLLIFSARKHWSPLNRMFAGFRKISLDDLRKANVVCDAQQYILYRLDSDEYLRSMLVRFQQTAEMLNLLHIKSSGCMLFMERVLDGILDGFLHLDEISAIPGTLNGLYLWLCKRLFSRQQFEEISKLFNILLAAKTPLSYFELYQVLWTSQMTLSLEDFHEKMDLLSNLLIEAPKTSCTNSVTCSPLRSSANSANTGTVVTLFHSSFAEWLLDVKYCTQRYLCNLDHGCAMLAMWHAAHAQKLAPNQLVDFAFYSAYGSLDRCFKEPWQLPLWMLACGAPIQDLVLESGTLNPATSRLLIECGADIVLPEDVSSLDPIQQPFKSPSAKDIPQCRRLSLPSSSNCSQEISYADTTASSSGLGDGDSLIEAARLGKALDAERLLIAGVDANQTDSEGWSALRGAAWAGHIDMIELLLQYSADVDYCDDTGRTALRAAAWAGHEHIVNRLIIAGADVNGLDSDGRSPLVAAVYMGHTEVVSCLLSARADPNLTDRDQRSPLTLAILTANLASDQLEVCRRLVSHGADVNHLNAAGHTPLILAASEGCLDLCELLVENDADLDFADETGLTALFAAAENAHKDVVEFLLGFGADIDAIDQDGRTVLSIAAAAEAAENAVALVEFLLRCGTDELHRDNHGWIALHHAASSGSDQVCAVLAAHNPRNVDESDAEGRHPLLLAVENGHIEACRVLIRHGSSLEKHCLAGRRPLLVALEVGHQDIATLLLENGAKLDTCDLEGRSLLHSAVLEHHLDIAEFLLLQGAYPDTRDASGRTPLQLASYLGHVDMVQLLLRWGAAVNAVDTDNRSPLLTATWRGHGDLMRLLLEQNAQVSLACKEGATPLHVAAQLGRFDLVRLLLQYKADTEMRDSCGRRPADVAERMGHEEALVLLLLANSIANDDVEQLITTALPSTLSGCSDETKTSGIGTGYSSLELPVDTPRQQHLSNFQRGNAQLLSQHNSESVGGNPTATLSSAGSFGIGTSATGDSGTTVNPSDFMQTLLRRYLCAEKGSGSASMSQSVASTPSSENGPALEARPRPHRPKIVTNPRFRPKANSEENNSSFCANVASAKCPRRPRRPLIVNNNLYSMS